VTCFEGLLEEGHPYNFISFNAIKEMLEEEVKIKIINLKGSLRKSDSTS